MLVRAPTGRAHHTCAVTVIHHQLGAEFVAKASKSWQIPNVAFHTEDAVGDHPRLTGHLGIRSGGL